MSETTTAVQRLLTAMAYNREEFKNRIEEKVGGALLEYYKAVLASLNRQTRWVRHWQAEVDRLLHTELVVVLLHSIKGFKGRQKAAREVLHQLRAGDGRYRRAAEHIIKRDYDLKKLATSIRDTDTDNFYRMVREVIDTHTS